MAIVRAIVQPVGNWIKAWVGPDYSIGHDAATATWGADPTHCTVGNSGLPYASHFTIYRALFKVDLTSLPPSSVIDSAVLSVHRSWAQTDLVTMEAVLVDGAGVPMDDSGYGTMLRRFTNCGSISIPAPFYTEGEDYQFALNPNGIAVLEAAAGGWAYFGIRLGSDINNIAPVPGQYKWWTFNYAADAEIAIDLKAARLVEEVFNVMVIILLAKFMLDDMPRAAGLFDNPSLKQPSKKALT